MFYIGCFILLLFIIFYRDDVRIEWGSIAKFLAFMSLVTVIRIATADFVNSSGHGIPSAKGLSQIKLWSLILVFWEDAFFVLPIVYLRKRFNWWVCALPAAALTVYFGFGHAYQGTAAIYITALYPMLVSYRYGIKVGFGTIMICHILYDFITVFTAYFIKYLLSYL